MERGRVVGVAGVRTVAHGFYPWEIDIAVIREPASAGKRKLFSRPSRRAHKMGHRHKTPPVKPVGYGSYAGFADGFLRDYCYIRPDITPSFRSSSAFSAVSAPSPTRHDQLSCSAPGRFMRASLPRLRTS